MAADDIPTSFVTPQRSILTIGDIGKWEKSRGYRDITQFIAALNVSVKGKKLTDELELSEDARKLLALLEHLSDQVDKVEPIEQPQRFGNKAFRIWYGNLQESGDQLLRNMLPEDQHASIVELSAYLKESFGNSTRIDYGTGHELNFVIFLCCLFKISFLLEKDAPAAVLKIFDSYIQLCRKLQEVYRMEPAGSHGVWSIDDYQFIPFIWGSGQLIDHPKLKPAHFVEPDYFQSFAKDYIFFACIKYICQMKTGPFAEHSNQLWNISGVAEWTKVNQGLIKMYKAETLSKFPVVQHCVFGNLFSIESA